MAKILVEDYGFNPKTGFYARIYSRIKLYKKLALQTEFLYALEGSEYESNTNFATQNIDISTNNIIVPVVFQYEVIKNLRLELGTQLNYFINGKTSSEVEILSTREIIKVSEDFNHFSKFRASINTGITYSPFNNFDVSVRYNHGINRLVDNGSPRILNAYVVSTGIGYTFL